MQVVLDGLEVRYGARTAVTGVGLAARGGEVLALVGPNGSGKSSLLRAVAGLQRHGGSVVFEGVPRGGIGFMPQDSGARTGLTVLETVLLGRHRALGWRVPAAEVARAGDVLRSLGIAHLAARPIGELSGGQRQMVFLAQVLAAEPAVLLLDEPTSALDIRHALQLLALVRDLTRARGLVTVVAIHDLNAAARFADRMALLRDGRLMAAGPPDAVLTEATIAEVYRVAAHVHVAPDGHVAISPSRALADR
ncbi:ABC transporter ATP-binding protein [Neoroseomonas oryzicola]|uniref:ABC transporter ATP-binding protein n=1 Tax=Neoroseomonas oryzicola TaxID=535904 RepID=A0A9X9WI34_9PROT|nr:ABC transporter ATP-binding protein [Neoroseomonas oryzicola]MBR0659994.1 ABC transporter ATP-binding protein [Neoroseomonas oryzicola]NKE19454.1 ABC transporter ATP-binding protein [Neoroseomonas oryzicola]